MYFIERKILFVVQILSLFLGSSWPQINTDSGNVIFSSRVPLLAVVLNVLYVQETIKAFEFEFGNGFPKFHDAMW